jgi:ribose-phosphate pyrophosphokinase
MKIFSGTSNKPLAGKIAKDLGIELSDLEIFVFPDGEKRITLLEKVLDEDTIVVQSTSNPADENYMQLFFIVDALKRSGAKSVTAVIPYLGYQRQDHVFREGEAVSLEVIVKTLESTGVTKIITLDLHSVKIPELFHLPIEHLSAIPLFAKKIKEEKWNDKKTFLVSPDMGGIRRIKLLSEELSKMAYVSIEKNRDLSTGEVAASKINGEILSRAIIVDDMISSGKTISVAADILKKNGVEEIFVFATHPVFSSDAPKILQDSKVEKVYVTDSVLIPEEKKFPKLEILSVSKMIAESVKSA